MTRNAFSFTAWLIVTGLVAVGTRLVSGHWPSPGQLLVVFLGCVAGSLIARWQERHERGAS